VFPPTGSVPDSDTANTVAQLHRLSRIARDKLYREATYPDRSLVRLVGHANLLDDILGRIDDADAEAEAAFERSVSSSCSRGCGVEEWEGEVEEGEEEELAEVEEGEGGGGGDRAYYASSSESESSDDEETDSDDDDSDDEIWEDFKGDEDGEVDDCLYLHDDPNAKQVRVIYNATEDSDEEVLEGVDVGSVEEHLPSAGFKNTYMVQFLGPPRWR